MKKVMVLGASPNKRRFSYSCVKSLLRHGYDVVPIGKRSGVIDEVNILTQKPQIRELDTVTLYLNSENQKEYYDYILELKPNRIIFNPGAENPEFKKMAEDRDISAVEKCTLVMLNSGNF